MMTGAEPARSARRERPAADDGDAERFEVAVADFVHLRQPAVARIRDVLIVAKRRAHEPELEQRDAARKRGRLHAGHARQPLEHTPIQVASARFVEALRAGVHAEDHRGRRTGTRGRSAARCDRLRRNKPALISATSESATWPATSRWRTLYQRVPPGSVVRSLSSVTMSGRDAWRAGARPKRMPVASETSAAKDKHASVEARDRWRSPGGTADGRPRAGPAPSTPRRGRPGRRAARAARSR